MTCNSMSRYTQRSTIRFPLPHQTCGYAKERLLISPCDLRKSYPITQTNSIPDLWRTAGRVFGRKTALEECVVFFVHIRFPIRASDLRFPPS